MPANDEFPRGWVLSVAPAAPNAASITVPAVPGIAHVLTAVYGRIQNPTGGNFGANILVNGNFLSSAVTSGAATPIVVDETDRTDMKIVGAVGAALTVAFSLGAAGVLEYLTIQGYDI